MHLRNEFVRIQAEGWTFQLRPELAEPAFANLCALPASVFSESVVPVVSSANTEVRRFSYQERVYFLKEYFFLGWKKHLKVLRRGEHLVRIATLMEDHGFLTPRVVGIGRGGKNRRVVTEAVENARDVWQVLFPDWSRYRGAGDDGFVLALGRTIGRFHEEGFFHGDLRWRNILTRMDQDVWEFYFIDNDRTRFFRFGIPFRCRVKNLTQMLFSGMLLDWPESDWEIFLQGYFQGSALSPSLRNKLRSKAEEQAAKRYALRKKEGKITEVAENI